MADVVKSVGTVGRDYGSWTDWEADLDDAGIYSAGDVAIGEGYDDAAFDETVTVDGGGTVGLGGIAVRAATGEGHDGTAGTGVRFVKAGDGNNFIYGVDSPAFTLSQIEFDANGHDVGNSASLFSTLTTDSSPTVQRCLFHGVVAPTAGSENQKGIGLRVGGKIHNNIFYAIEGDDACHGFFTLSSARELSVQNNTAFDIVARKVGGIGYSFNSDTANYTIQNNIGMDCDTDFNSSAFTLATQNNNLSSDATATGTGSLTNQTTADQFVSTVAGSEDLHLKSGADAIDAGADLGATPTGVNLDIDGRDRDGEGDTWDIGAHEFVAGGGGATGESLYRHTTLSGLGSGGPFYHNPLG